MRQGCEGVVYLFVCLLCQMQMVGEQRGSQGGVRKIWRTKHTQKSGEELAVKFHPGKLKLILPISQCLLHPHLQILEVCRLEGDRTAEPFEQGLERKY